MIWLTPWVRRHSVEECLGESSAQATLLAKAFGESWQHLFRERGLGRKATGSIRVVVGAASGVAQHQNRQASGIRACNSATKAGPPIPECGAPRSPDRDSRQTEAVPPGKELPWRPRHAALREIAAPGWTCAGTPEGDRSPPIEFSPFAPAACHSTASEVSAWNLLYSITGIPRMVTWRARIA